MVASLWSRFLPSRLGRFGFISIEVISLWSDVVDFDVKVDLGFEELKLDVLKPALYKQEKNFKVFSIFFISYFHKQFYFLYFYAESNLITFYFNNYTFTV